MDKAQSEQDFLSNPNIIRNYSLLQDIGVFRHIELLKGELRNYKSLLTGATDIFNRTTIEEIMDSTVWQISDQFLPSFIVFLWKPLQNREEITIKGYKNYKPVDISLNMPHIGPFEPFFQAHREPISYKALMKEMGKISALQPLKELAPELVVPILGPSGLYGLILVGRKILSNDYTQPEQDYLRQLMAFVSQAIQNHLHYEHSVRDVKTGLFNHGFFMTRLNDEIARTRRSEYTSSLIVIDVDKFKNFNDTYGHLAGDRVLESLAYLIKENVRAEDVPSRFGGEEFTILLPNTDKHTAWIVAERLRCSIAEMDVAWITPLPHVTISLGLVSFNKETNVPADDIIRRADEALYQSKERGRNQTTLWKSGLLFTIQHKYARIRRPDREMEL